MLRLDKALKSWRESATLNPARLGQLVGDLLVRMPSSSGRGTGKGRRIPFELDNGHKLPGLNHFQLLNHPAVYAQLRLWLTRKPRRPKQPIETLQAG